jgi:regulator of replication initiation timing
MAVCWPSVAGVLARKSCHVTSHQKRSDAAKTYNTTSVSVSSIALQEEALGLFQELKRQATEAPRFESQLDAATQRVLELEAQVNELEQENQTLAGVRPGLLAGSSPGSPMASQLASTDASGNFYGANRTGVSQMVMHRNNLYADDAAMAASAIEQQLAVVESQAVAAKKSAEELASENVQLRREVQKLQSLTCGRQAGAREDPPDCQQVSWKHVTSHWLGFLASCCLL